MLYYSDNKSVLLLQLIVLSVYNASVQNYSKLLSKKQLLYILKHIYFI